jgi:ornithine decarboxylase
MSFKKPSFLLDKRIELKDQKTPFLLLDLKTLAHNCIEYLRTFQGAEVYYSVKANSHKLVLQTLKSHGIKFDIASQVELDLLLAIGVDPKNTIYSAPTKIPEHIHGTFNKGVRVFAFDSRMELEKLAHYAPGSMVVARVTVPNTGSEWPLEKKFGLDEADIIPFMLYAKSLGLIPYGLTFHVGSQNPRLASWSEAIDLVGGMNKRLVKEGIEIGLLNAGGGFPARYEKEIPLLEEFANVIFHSKKKYFGDKVRLLVEPGRGLVASAGVIASTVINRSNRKGKNWLYLDVGVFNGVFEAEQGIRFALVTDREDQSRDLFTVCGPSCDSVDIIMDDVSLPAGIGLGERVYFLSAGAYTISYEKYNGLSYPEVIPIQ